VKFYFLIGAILTSFSVRAEFLPKGFSAKFEQEYVSLLKGKTKKGSGSIDYLYPSNIRFETSTPSQVIFVSNGKTNWYYRAPFIEGEAGEVTESAAKDGGSVYIKFFDSLKNGLTSNKLYDVGAEKDLSQSLSFKEKAAKDFGLKEAVLFFKSTKLRDFSSITKIDLIFIDGKKSTLSFNELKINPNFDATKFQFIAPAGTRKSN
jgi:outer membrane lipoprotein-sorting protein